MMPYDCPSGPCPFFSQTRCSQSERAAGRAARAGREVERRDLRVRGLLVVVVVVLAAGAAHLRRACRAPSTLRDDVEAVDAVVAEFAGAQVPEPVPVVVEAVLRELARRRPEPEVVIDALRAAVPASRCRCSAGRRRSTPARTRPCRACPPARTRGPRPRSAGCAAACRPGSRPCTCGPPRPSAAPRSGCATPASRRRRACRAPRPRRWRARASGPGPTPPPPSRSCLRAPCGCRFRPSGGLAGVLQRVECPA